jgi:hypothetical protein
LADFRIPFTIDTGVKTIEGIRVRVLLFTVFVVFAPTLGKR